MSKTVLYETATLGGGCFWCTEAVFQQVRGVKAVESGYCGGHLDEPTYREICEGDTGHAEVVKVVFDPAVIPYRHVLEIFFVTHDPTTLNRQGNDVGTQYRSVIFTHDDAQAEIARQVITELSMQRIFDAPIVTEIEPVPRFWRAEEYHQNYYRQNPYQGYCAFVISPKVAKFRAHCAQWLSD